MEHIYAELLKSMRENWVIYDDVHNAISALKNYHNCEYKGWCTKYANRALKCTQRAMSAYCSANVVMRKYDIAVPYDADAVYKALDRLYAMAFAATYDS